MENLTSTNDESSQEEVRSQLLSWLGVDEEISDKAWAAVISNPLYAQKLGSVRKHPAALRHLLKNPPTSSPHGGDLMAKAGRSIGQWVHEGFKQASPETRARRMTACDSCPHLEFQPRKMLQRAAGAVMRSKKTCGLCGCNILAKIRLPHENCPDLHPEKPGKTRWMEPIDR